MFINYLGRETEQTTKDSTEMKNEFVFVYIFFYRIKYKSISLLCSKLITSASLLIEGYLIHTKRKLFCSKRSVNIRTIQGGQTANYCCSKYLKVVTVRISRMPIDYYSKGKRKKRHLIMIFSPLFTIATHMIHLFFFCCADR